MPQTSDFLSVGAWLPASVTAVANIIAIHSLWSPDMSRPKYISIAIYTAVTALLTIGLLFFGASQSQGNREQSEQAKALELKVDTIRNVLGSAPGTSGEQVLDKIIAKFSQPMVISAPQIARMSHDIAFLKDTLPPSVFFARSAPGYMNGADYQLWNPLNEMFLRNGIQTTWAPYNPTSIDEVGLMIIFDDPLNPPLYVQKLLSAFNLAGIIDIKLKNVPSLLSKERLTILIGPSPI